jgi:hypothetical protein
LLSPASSAPRTGMAIIEIKNIKKLNAKALLILLLRHLIISIPLLNLMAQVRYYTLYFKPMK